MSLVKVPFIAGGPVAGQYFVNREEELEKISLLVKAGRSVAIISPRRYGKTSLLISLRRSLESENFLVGYIDCMTVPDLADLSQEIAEAILQNEPRVLKLLRDVWTGAKGAIAEAMRRVRELEVEISDILTIHVEFAEGKGDARKLLESSLDFVEKYAQKIRKRMILILDEFGELQSKDSELLRLMRSRIQFHKSVSYIISGSQVHTLKYIATSKASPFFGFFEVFLLDQLPEEDVKEFLEKRYREFGIEPKLEAINTLISKVGGHPFYVQKLALRAYLDIIAGKKMLSSGVVESAYEEMISELTPLFEAMLSDLSKASIQLKVLKVMAKRDTSSPYVILGEDKTLVPQKVKQAVDQLIRKGYLKKMKRGRYEFIDFAFKDYLKRII